MEDSVDTPKHIFKQLLTEKALVLLLLIWTPVILGQTWIIQHSSHPVVDWTPTPPSQVTQVTVKPQEVKNKIGETRIITATVNAKGDAIKDVNWSSKNPKIATVNSHGLVTAVSEGNATITATSKQDSSKQDSSIVKISSIPSEIISLTKDVTWSSSNNKVANVDDNGLVTSISEGDADITATSNQDSSKQDSSQVRVSLSEKPEKPPESPGGIKLATLMAGAVVTVGTIALGVTAAPALAAGAVVAFFIQLVSSRH